MGGLLLPNNRGFRIPYTGGEPLPDWTGLAGAALHHGSPNCNRPTDPDAAAKSWNLRIAEPKHLLKRNDPEFGITELSAQVRFHTKQFGLDNVMYIPSRANAARPAVNLITSYDQVTLEHVILSSNLYCTASRDEYDIVNDAAMQIYLQNCLDIPLKSMLALYIHEEDTAATTWMRIVKSIHDTSVNLYRQLKIDVTKLTPLNEPGQDIKEYTIKVRKIFEELTSARHFTWDLMVPVLRALEQVSVVKFTGFIPQIEENVNAGIMETAFMLPDAASTYMRDHGIHWETVLEQMETRYESLFSSSSWEPSNFGKGSPQANALVQQGSEPTKKGPCHHCGSKEHWANKCTEKSIVPPQIQALVHLAVLMSSLGKVSHHLLVLPKLLQEMIGLSIGAPNVTVVLVVGMPSTRPSNIKVLQHQLDQLHQLQMLPKKLQSPHRLLHPIPTTVNIISVSFATLRCGGS